MFKLIAVFLQKALDCAFFNLIKIRHHFFRETVFTIKKHPSKTEIFLKSIHSVSVIQHVLPLDI